MPDVGEVSVIWRTNGGYWIVWRESFPNSTYEILARDVQTGKDLVNHPKWVKFSSISWAKDASGFHYSRFDGPEDGKFLVIHVTEGTAPGTIYRYDIETGESTLWKRPKVAFDGDAYETRQVFVPSKDATKVPLFITHRIVQNH